jgi:hypothetical protein
MLLKLPTLRAALGALMLTAAGLCGAPSAQASALTPEQAAQSGRPAVCPAALEQLAELLASSQQRIGREADLSAEFEVDAQGRARALSVQGPRRYHSPVRIAVSSLDCQGGRPQRYALNLRFADSFSAKADKR